MGGLRNIGSGSHDLGGANLKALPGLDYANQANEALLEMMQDGERGPTVKKAGAYLGYRALNYCLVPLVANLVSTVVSGLLYLVSLPFRCCSDKAARFNAYSWDRMVDSAKLLGGNLIWDLTCDVRQLGRLCSCTPEWLYEIAPQTV